MVWLWLHSTLWKPLAPPSQNARGVGFRVALADVRAAVGGPSDAPMRLAFQSVQLKSQDCIKPHGRHRICFANPCMAAGQEMQAAELAPDALTYNSVMEVGNDKVTNACGHRWPMTCFATLEDQ